VEVGGASDFQNPYRGLLHVDHHPSPPVRQPPHRRGRERGHNPRLPGQANNGGARA
jgi:hypothetical protein